MRQYDDLHDWFVSARSPAIGLDEVAALTARLPAGARVLDLGCGTGRPIARFLADQRFRVSGIDSSPRMIAAFRANVPEGRARCEPLQHSTFFGERFDAVISWGVLFHLDAGDQAAVIAKAAQALVPGGRFLFTATELDVVCDNPMQDQSFVYTSLGLDRYARLLDTSGLTLMAHHSDAWDNYVYIAERRPAEPLNPGRSD